MLWADTLMNLLKTSYTVIMFIIFIILGSALILKRKKTLLMLTIGAGLFFIASIIIGISDRSNMADSYITLFKINNILEIYLLAYFLLTYLNRRIPVFCKILLIAALSLPVLELMGNKEGSTYMPIAYFLFVISICVYVYKGISMLEEQLPINKYIMGVFFLAKCGLNIVDIAFIKNPIYQTVNVTINLFVLILFINYIFIKYYKLKVENLFEKEACFDYAFNYSKDGMVLVDLEGNIMRTNSALKELFGLPDEKLLGLSFTDIIHRDDREPYINNIEKIAWGNEASCNMVRRCYNSKGEVIWTLLNVSLIKNKKDKPLYYIHQIQSLTSYMKLQNELLESTEKYRVIMSSYNEPIAVLDNEFRYKVANQSIINLMNTILGRDFNSSTIIGHKVTDIDLNFENIDLYKNLKEVMDTKIPKIVIDKFNCYSGNTMWFEIHIAPIPEGIIIYGIDITERIKEEKVLFENELKYRRLVEQSYDGIILADENGKIIEFNRQMEKITGLERGKTIGSFIWDIHFQLAPPELKSEELYNRLKVRVEEKSKLDSNEFEEQSRFGEIHRDDGGVIYIQDMCYPIISDNTRYTCYIFRDITELKKLQEIKEKAAEKDILLREAMEMDKLKTEFFANLSHEFRTPLNIILSSNDMLLRSAARERTLSEEYLNKHLMVSKQNCYRLLRLINNIIDTTKIDAGFLYMNFKNYNIVSIVEDITQSIVVYAKNKNISVIFDTEIEEKYIMCDADKIERVMLNLLSNAIKFTNSGGEIEVNVIDNNEFVTINVIDNGIGIPEEKVSYIFDRFRQVDKSLTRKQEGSGIGLSLVKSLVEMHSGSVGVSSIAGKGSVFTVSLPTSNDLCDEIAVTGENYDDRVEKANIEFSDIYFND